MDRKIIATIRLGAGNVGFFDELTRIHLTLINPYADVYSDMNTNRLKRALKYGTITLVNGSLTPPKAEESKLGKAFSIKVGETKQEAKPQINLEDINKTAEKVVISDEDVQLEEPKKEVEEEKPKKKTTKKTTKKNAKTDEA